MLENYFKSTYRNLRQHPGYSLINLSGLAVGMASCLLIALYLNDELSYDRYHENRDEIHRVVIDYTTNGNTSEQGYTQGILGPVLTHEIPEVVDAVRMTNAGGLIGYEDKLFNESSFILTDPSIFSVFSFSLLRGDPELALVEPYSIVLTPPMAEKYFGSEDPLGKVLSYNNDRQLTVTGIVDVPPAQSHFTFDGLMSMSTIDNADAPTWMFQEWLSTFVQTYVLLIDKNAAPVVESKMADLVEREAGAMMQNNNQHVDLYLESLSDIYLTSQRDGLGARGSLKNLYLFGFIAGFILLIACINFMNLATARAMGRAREVGVRKSLGAARNQLVFQFLGEAIFVSLLSMATALLLVKLSLPAFNLLTGKSLFIATLFQPAVLGWILSLVLFVGLLAGSYPAFVLSHFKPVSVLKGTLGSWQRGEQLRKSLVVFQFAISIALIAATCVVYLQLQFMKTQQLGFEKEHVLLLDFNGDNAVRQRLATIQQELARQPGVRSVSASQTVPGRGLPASGGMVRLVDGSEQEISVGLYMVDFDFVDLYKMDIVAGRSFSSELSTDSSEAIILSEAAVKRLGLANPQDAIGLDASFWGNSGQVIGVSRDIHHFALQTSIAPMALRIDSDNLSLFSVSIEASNMASTIAGLQSTWTTLVPQRPFNYEFLDEAFDAQYRSEERFGSVFIVFTILSMLIACLGLFGLATFTVLSRTKEIGVRKVLGASTRSVLFLLSKDFTRLVVIAILLATPIVYLAMNRWLESFPYRTDIPWWLFVAAGAGALFIAWLTVGTQSLRAAHANPVDALKYE